MGAGVINLVDHHYVVAMTFFSDPTEMRNDGIVFMQEVAANESARAMRRHWFDHDHGGAAPGAFAVISEMTIARQALIAHIDRMRPEDQAILERLVPEPDRRKQGRKCAGHGNSPLQNLRGGAIGGSALLFSISLGGSPHGIAIQVESQAWLV